MQSTNHLSYKTEAILQPDHKPANQASRIISIYQLNILTLLVSL